MINFANNVCSTLFFSSGKVGNNETSETRDWRAVCVVWARSYSLIVRVAVSGVRVSLWGCLRYLVGGSR